MTEQLFRTLVTTDTLLEIARAIQATPADWDLIGQKAQDTLPDVSINNHPYLALGMLSEIHVHNVLDTLARQGANIETNPITQPQTTGRFHFVDQGYGGWEVLDTVRTHRIPKTTHDQGKYVQYDGLILVEGIPTVLEVKMGQERMNIIKALSVARINHLLHPLEEYFNTTTFSYIVVMSSDKVNQDSQKQRDLIEAGGLVTPFYTTTREFLEEMSLYKHQWMINWSEYTQESTGPTLGEICGFAELVLASTSYSDKE